MKKTALLTSKNQRVSLFVAIIIGLLGGVVFLIQEFRIYSLREDAESARIGASEKYNTLLGEITDVKKQLAITDRYFSYTPAENGNDSTGYPIVIYGRQSLIEGSDAAVKEKEQIEEKLVRPMIDYYNENGVVLTSLVIAVPLDVGDEYHVLAVFGGGGGDRYGYDAFLFGAREQEYDYWTPGCFGPCEYSDVFAEKYPEIVGE